MKKLVAFVCLVFSTYSALAQNNDSAKFTMSPLVSPRAYVKTKNLDISYGQPSKRERVIFGGLVPYGQVWRTGANEATEIRFKKRAMFGGKAVDTGTYTLFTVPEEKSWTIILNTQPGQWGAFEYEKYKGKDVARISAPVQTLDKVQEKLLFDLKKDSLFITWDKTKVAIPISFKSK